jgi:hypothetical protein
MAININISAYQWRQRNNNNVAYQWQRMCMAIMSKEIMASANGVCINNVMANSMA